MFKKYFLILTSFFLLTVSANVYSDQSKKVELIDFDTDESIERLSRAKYKVDFFPLSNHFESQDNSIVCGLASTAIILNAMRLRTGREIPVDKSSISEKERIYLGKFDPFFPKYTQNNILNSSTKSKMEVLGKPVKVNGKEINDFGIQLKQLAQIFRAHGATVDERVVSDKVDLKKTKKELIKNLITKGDYVLVNYARKSVGQVGGGHISPIGAYDEKSDSFLVMDVSPVKAPWVWIKSDDLMAATHTFDTVENRGFLFISK